MVTTVVRFRNPFPPHSILAEVRSTNLAYGFKLMEPATGSFQVARSEPSLDPGIMRIGAMVSIERSDRVLPFVGFVNRRVVRAGAPKINFVCTDHAGALFERARLPKDWSELSTSSGDILTQIFGDIERRAEPPLLVQLEQKGGPVVTYQPQAESFLEFLGTLADFSGWEWLLRHDPIGTQLHTSLVWKGKQGLDRRTEVIFEQTQDFKEVTLTEDAEGFLGTAVVIGGSGSVADRDAVQVSTSGRTEGSISGRQLSGGPVRPSSLSPILEGTTVIWTRQVSNQEALFAGAKKLYDLPVETREQLSPKLIESEIDMAKLGVGDIITVRLSDIDMGSSLIRVCRVLGLQLNPEAGIVDAELLVLPEESVIGA
ncbi:hypothetical protein LCGC14_0577650 [marine sediment metagenome]|uniref:Tip attachment protein J domain-containing protein n=1 Tax=marine sediment metagenome TaxID=412755 RepID=A0A0F9S100_9ZZZZ